MGHLPVLLLLVPLSPREATADPHFHRRLQPQEAGLVQSPVGSLLPSPGSWCMQDFVCLLQEESLPQSCGSPVIKSHWPSESDCLGIPSPFAGLQAWHEAQNLHNSGRTFLVLLFSSLLFSHLAGMGFIFIVLESLLDLVVVSSLCLDLGHPFSAGPESSSGWLFNSQLQFCFSFVRSKCMSFFSAILNQNLSQNFDI